MYTLRRARGYKFDFLMMRYDSDSAETSSDDDCSRCVEVL